MKLSLYLAAAAIVLAVCLPFMKFCYVSIPTGFIGVPYRWQQVVEPLLRPGGPHLFNPLTTSIVLVETRPQTDVVKNIHCGTNDGVKLVIKNIEIGNQLPVEFVFNTTTRFGPDYDKYLVTDLVIHQISVICSKQSAHEIAISNFDQIDDLLVEFLRSENERQNTGLQVQFVRPTRPELPASLDAHYLAMAEEKTLKKVLEEKKERIKIEKDSEKLIAQRDNEIALARVDNENAILMKRKQTKLEEAKIENEMVIAAASAKADGAKREAIALKAFYEIPGYAATEQVKALSNNEKIYYGEKLPTNFPLLQANQQQ